MNNREDLDPVMLAYGKACFAAQGLENSLRSLLKTLEMNNRWNGNDFSCEAVESKKVAKVLGDLFKEAQKKEYFTNAECMMINRAIKERNFLIHSYWPKRIELVMRKSGRKWIVSNIEEIHELIEKACDIVTSLNHRYLKEFGLDEYIEFVVDAMWESDVEPPQSLSH